MKVTTYGLDLAKRVFQVHWMEPQTGEIRHMTKLDACCWWWLTAAGMLTAAVAGAQAAPVPTRGGPIAGVEESGNLVYKGIPFAAPPVGRLRWRAPEPAAPWQGVLRATVYRPRCMQVGPNYPGGPEDEALSEDCLYLNIWKPVSAPQDAKLPVMVWIYGGGFQNGSASDPFYRGDNLAKKGVIVVNINYRLGPLGFLAHPELTAESPHHASGNYGLMDMIAALHWVKANIAAFGGDAGTVTIFGQSAGSAAVNLLQASPLARGLFQRAIGESGGAFMPPETPYGASRLEDAEAEGTVLAQELGARSLAELRALSADKVSAAGRMGPDIDGWVIPAPLLDIFAAGRQTDVPILLGYTSGEGDNLVGEPLQATPWKEAIRRQFGSHAERVLAHYPAGTDEEAARSQRLSERDFGFGWAMWTWAALQRRTGRAPVYGYYFDHRLPLPDHEPFRHWGVQHGAEVFYLMQHYVPGWSWTEEDRRLGDTMASYWTNFARTGDPNGPGLPHWPEYRTTDRKVMHFADEPTVAELPNQEAMKLMDDFVVTLKPSASGR
jgi:para-nitrobenzyl esterase